MNEKDPAPVPLGVGDKAPDFDLPAADHDGRVSLAEYRARGPVLLLFLRGFTVRSVVAT
jgi:peroxiredoxin